MPEGAVKTDYDREQIEAMRAMDMPKVRCKYNCDYIDEDGRRESGTRETTGRIVVDGNNPWLEIWAGGRCIAEQFSWGLVLEVINDKRAAPIWFTARVEYKV